jgi:hypothetical protein
MAEKHSRHSKSFVPSSTDQSRPLSERERKKLELGEAMEHEHGQTREDIEEDIEKLDEGTPKRTAKSN